MEQRSAAVILTAIMSSLVPVENKITVILKVQGEHQETEQRICDKTLDRTPTRKLSNGQHIGQHENTIGQYTGK